MHNLFRRHHVSLSFVVAAVLVAVALLLMPNLSAAGPATLSAAGLLMGLMRFAVAVAALFLVLRALDWVAEFNWPEMSNAIETNALASAVYLGLRFIAVAWIAGECLS